MKSLLLSLIVSLTCVVSIVSARPQPSFLVKGNIRSVDFFTHVIVLEHSEPGKPSTFHYVAGTSDFKRDRQSVTAAELTIGQFVSLYYKRDGDRFVIADIHWAGGSNSSAKKSGPTER